MNQQEAQRLLSLIEEMKSFCQVYLGYSDKTLISYERRWLGLLRLMNETCINVFDEQSYHRLLKIIKKKKKSLDVNRIPTEFYQETRALKMLYSFQESRTISIYFHEDEIEITHVEPWNSIYLDFIQFLTLKQRRAKNTIRAYTRTLHEFISYLEKNKICNIDDFCIADVLNYIIQITPETKVTPTLQIGHIRGFLKFLHITGYTSIDMSAMMPRCRRIKQPKLPSVYSEEELSLVLQSNPRITEIEKRDYAILLIIMRLGLRASDVARIKFCNINWRKNTINIIQYKTGNPIELPLLADVGNAIIDYIKNGRPNINHSNIFLRQRYPYAMKSDSIWNIVNNAFKISGIDTKGRRRGPHALRHSLTARMLEKEITMPVITEVLGHENSETTQYYMRIDVKSMSHCVIDVLPLNPNYFKKLNFKNVRL